LDDLIRFYIQSVEMLLCFAGLPKPQASAIAVSVANGRKDQALQSLRIAIGSGMIDDAIVPALEEFIGRLADVTPNCREMPPTLRTSRKQ